MLIKCPVVSRVTLLTLFRRTSAFSTPLSMTSNVIRQMQKGYRALRGFRSRSRSLKLGTTAWLIVYLICSLTRLRDVNDENSFISLGVV